MHKLGNRLLMFALVFSSFSTHSAPTDGKIDPKTSHIDKLVHEIGQSSFSSVFSGLKEQMNVRDFERAMAAFQDLRGSSTGADITTEEVFRAMGKQDERQAFNLKSFIYGVLRVCVPAIDENREKALMNSEERNYRKQFKRDYSGSCSTSLENILDKRTPNQQTAGVVVTPPSGGSSAAN